MWETEARQHECNEDVASDVCAGCCCCPWAGVDENSLWLLFLGVVKTVQMVILPGWHLPFYSLSLISGVWGANSFVLVGRMQYQNFRRFSARPPVFGRGQLSGTRDSRCHSRESIRANHSQARQADSPESLEFPIRANHPIRANRFARFARITPLRAPPPGQQHRFQNDHFDNPDFVPEQSSWQWGHLTSHAHSWSSQPGQHRGMKSATSPQGNATPSSLTALGSQDQAQACTNSWWEFRPSPKNI